MSAVTCLNCLKYSEILKKTVVLNERDCTADHAFQILNLLCRKEHSNRETFSKCHKNSCRILTGLRPLDFQSASKEWIDIIHTSAKQEEANIS